MTIIRNSWPNMNKMHPANEDYQLHVYVHEMFLSKCNGIYMYKVNNTFGMKGVRVREVSEPHIP